MRPHLCSSRSSGPSDLHRDYSSSRSPYGACSTSHYGCGAASNILICITLRQYRDLLFESLLFGNAESCSSTGGKPSTWSPPGGLAEWLPTIQPRKANTNTKTKITKNASTKHVKNMCEHVFNFQQINCWGEFHSGAAAAPASSRAAAPQTMKFAPAKKFVICLWSEPSPA